MVCQINLIFAKSEAERKRDRDTTKSHTHNSRIWVLIILLTILNSFFFSLPKCFEYNKCSFIGLKLSLISVKIVNRIFDIFPLSYLAVGGIPESIAISKNVYWFYFARFKMSIDVYVYFRHKYCSSYNRPPLLASSPTHIDHTYEWHKNSERKRKQERERGTEKKNYSIYAVKYR